MVLGKEDKAAVEGGEIDYRMGATLLVNKPLEWTSFDVVNKLRWSIRKYLGIKKIKVGHAGTLDPLADGLLIICTGKSTKKISEYQGLPKEYSGTIKLGAVTKTFDAEAEEESHKDTSHLREDQIMDAIEKFKGKIMQRPPVYSALKKDGVPLYKKARKGEKVEVPEREVEIYDLQIEKIALPELTFRLKCSKGTYVRSLANDLGEELGVGGYLSSLSRDAIGPYRKSQAFEVKELCSLIFQNES